ncbi:MAG: sigma-70 family RNA polymerase sigma factor, partial [Bacteroidetes bacterium]|nr:sigma-70 family RNA polymerase sigma factor [Bacteroidota bacterium]
TGLFGPEQLRDVMQSINENLITRLPGIEQNYNGSVQMVTYMNAVIRNICLDIHRKEQQPVQIVSFSDTEHEFEEDVPFRSLLVQEELQRFMMILTLFHHQRSKLLLCLKLFHRMPLTVHDITDCFEQLPERDLTTLMSLFGKPFEETLESDIFNTIAPFMNRKENNQTSGASLRRWTQEQISRIISLLNRGKEHRTHTKETIRILLEHFTQQQRI